MGTIQRGAETAVKTCMKINKKDSVVIVADLNSKKIAEALEAECKKITKKAKLFILEEFSERPVKKLPDEIKNFVKKSTAVFFTAESFPGEKTTLRFPIIKYGVRRKNGARQAHMPGISEKIMEQGMNTDYKKIKKISKKVYDIVNRAKEIKVKTGKGTNITAKFNPGWRWITSDGDIANTPAKWSNLPDGEVFTAPFELNGKVVVDGCLGDYFINYGLLEHPIYLEIKNTRVAKLKTKNKKLEKELKSYIKQDKNANRVGEFSIGTNIGLKKLIGNLLQDEKFPGIHIALGDCYPNMTLAPYASKAHLDMVIKKTTIIADGKTIMKEGKFVI